MNRAFPATHRRSAAFGAFAVLLLSAGAGAATAASGQTQAARATSGSTARTVTADPAVDSALLEELKPSGAPTGASFGASVSASADFAVVGVPGVNTQAGRADVYQKTGARTWTLEASLTPSTSFAGQEFGASVATVGSAYIVVGAPGQGGAGQAFVFVRTGSTWNQVGGALTGSDSVSGDLFGASVGVSLFGDVIVGAPGHAGGTGEAYVYTVVNHLWEQQGAPLESGQPAAGGSFGSAVGLFDDTAVVGAPGENGQHGNGYVFSRTAGTWSPTGILGGHGSQAGAHFGASLSMPVGDLVVGAPGQDSGKQQSGAAYAYRGPSFAKATMLRPSDPAVLGGFGTSVAMAGTGVVVVGAPGTANASGSAYTLVRSAAKWHQTNEFTPADSAPGLGFGTSVSADGHGPLFSPAVLVGAPVLHAGTAYVYRVPVVEQDDSPSGQSVSSQQFDDPLQPYDDAAADDFVVRAKTRVDEIDIQGMFFQGGAPPVQQTVTIFRDAGGSPGTAISTTSASFDDPGNTGSYQLPIKPITLTKGRYWISAVSAGIADFGQWGWMTDATATGDRAVWENPPGGFGIGCTTWTVMANCFADMGGPDFVFAVQNWLPNG